MCQATTTHFGAFFALRFLLGWLVHALTLSIQKLNHCRDAGELRCSYPRADYIYVLQEGGTGTLFPIRSRLRKLMSFVLYIGSKDLVVLCHGMLACRMLRKLVDRRHFF